MIKKGWVFKGDGSNVYRLVQKLKRCMRLLKVWSKEAIPNNGKLVDELTKKVVEIQGG